MGNRIIERVGIETLGASGRDGAVLEGGETQIWVYLDSMNEGDKVQDLESSVHRLQGGTRENRA